MDCKHIGVKLLSEILLTQFDGLVQDCSISSANALEIRQSCTKPRIHFCVYATGYGGVNICWSDETLTYGGPNKMVDILLMAFSNALFLRGVLYFFIEI